MSYWTPNDISPRGHERSRKNPAPYPRIIGHACIIVAGPRGFARLLRVAVPPSLRHSYFVGGHLLHHDYLHYVQRSFMAVRQSQFRETATQTLRGSVLSALLLHPSAEGLATPAYFLSRGFTIQTARLQPGHAFSAPSAITEPYKQIPLPRSLFA
jgi:hypothetical protein